MTLRLVELPYPLAHQREILRAPERFKVACLGRQAGKTLMGGIAGIDGHGPRDDLGIPMRRGALHGATIWWVSKDYPTAKKIWRDLKTYLARWGGDLRKSEQDHRIDFPGGGSLTIKSAHDPDSLRGDTLDGLVGDEVAFWNPDSLNLALRPALAVKQGWFLLISTPCGLNFFREEWEKGVDGFQRRDPEYRSWHMPSSVNQALSKAELETMRRSLGTYGFRRECLAEFEVRSGGLFHADWFKTYREDANYLYPAGGEKVERRGLQVFVTADFAWSTRTYADFTVMMAWGRSPDGRLFAIAHERGQFEAPQIVPLLARFVELWGAKHVLLEASGPLVRLNAEAKRVLPGIVRELAIHAGPQGEKKDKVTRAEPASAAVEAGRVLLPEGAAWVSGFVTECCAFPDPKVHDDQVDALALAVLGARPRPDPASKPHVPDQRRRPPIFDGFDDGEGGGDWDYGYEGAWRS